jgi:3-hydroxyisobutyrate dehydrogenase-like beta-hydroxyacid dehydrogenase
MTTKQDAHRIITTYLTAASDFQELLRNLDGIIENGKRGALVVTNATAEVVPMHPLADRLTA